MNKAFLGDKRFESSDVIEFRYEMILHVSLRTSSPQRSGGAREKEGELTTTSLEFEYNLQYPCGSPSTELSDLRQSARSRNERKCEQTLRTRARVMTPLPISYPPISVSNRFFSRCRYLNSRDEVASSSFFSCPAELAHVAVQTLRT